MNRPVALLTMAALAFGEFADIVIFFSPGHALTEKNLCLSVKRFCYILHCRFSLFIMIFRFFSQCAQPRRVRPQLTGTRQDQRVRTFAVYRVGRYCFFDVRLHRPQRGKCTTLTIHLKTDEKFVFSIRTAYYVHWYNDNGAILKYKQHLL